jgi:glycosyltransferase involved in cell wall biosynthesis
MKVAIVGLRGFPDVQGGVEKHVESLAPLLVHQGLTVTVYVRAPYMTHLSGHDWHGVRLRRIWCPVNKFSETLVHTFLSVLAARIDGNQTIHFQAIGPSFFAPLARLLGMRVVMTHHGSDYLRQKWGPLARAYLKCSEYLGVRSAHRVVVISLSIQKFLLQRYRCQSVLIPNGVSRFPVCDIRQEALEPFGLSRGRYVLHVGRLVPEKRHHDLIDAFAKADRPGWKLVFVGAADHDDVYSCSVLARASESVCFLGRQNPSELVQLYAQCGLFALPSSHEGLPIALLEAMSLGAPFVLSDIEPHTELQLPLDCYFPLGDTDALASRIHLLTEATCDGERWEEWSVWVRKNYDWNVIAERTSSLYTLES